jgi:UDP-N-acetylmuramate--alanine ligase
LNFELNKIHSIYFLGIGGIGMSGLARYFNALGVNVKGYDRTCTSLTKELENEGISVHYEEEPQKITSEIDLVCYTPAIPKDNKEYQYAINKGYPLMKRSEVLGMLTKDKFTIAVSGTHGKTSITSLTAHILKHAGLKVTAFVGGICKNYNTNLILPDSDPRPPTSDFRPPIFIVEADEYDRSFLTLQPDIAVITAMDADHLDIYGSESSLHDAFIQFAGQIKKPNGVLIINSKLPVTSFRLPDPNTRIYSLNQTSDFRPQTSDNTFAYASNIKLVDSPKSTDHRKIYQFDITTGRNTIAEVNYHIPGRHNIENTVAATTIANELGIHSRNIMEGLETYNGVERRFDYRVNSKKIVYIDDYAHHPEELKACICAVKELYSNRKITGIFQPHLYTRTRDLAEGFAEALNMLDELILLDIYPARELPIQGITSEIILKAMDRDSESRNNVWTNKILCEKEEVIDILKKKEIEVLLTLGAGDIDTLVQPITELLKTKD